jgi:hypothetical protein
VLAEMGIGGHEALLHSPPGNHIYEILYAGLGLQLGNLLIVEVLDNLDWRARLSSERGWKR